MLDDLMYCKKIFNNTYYVVRHTIVLLPRRRERKDCMKSRLEKRRACKKEKNPSSKGEMKKEETLVLSLS